MAIFHIEEMITLDSWSDILNRPRYLATISPKQNQFKQILAVYNFAQDDNAQCAASDCLKTHNKGYLVAGSKEREVSLCEDCGHRFFETTFEDEKKAIAAQAHINEQKNRLNAVLEQANEIKNRINELKRVPYGANWLYQSLNNFRDAYPSDLVATLSELARENQSEAIDPSREEAHQLEGLGIFTQDIKDALINNILAKLKCLEQCAAHSDQAPTLATYCKWADNLEDLFDQAEWLVSQGRVFFNPKNFELLKAIPVSDKNAKIISSIQWGFDKGVLKKQGKTH